MKKVYKILLIVLLIIIMNITVINATSTTPPASNAPASEILNFYKDHKNENDEVWKSVSAETIENWLTTLSNSKGTNNAGVNAAITSMTNVLKKVSDKKKKEKEEAEKFIADAEKYNKELEIEYKTIPASDADAETINKFIKSENHYNEGKKFTNNEISLDIVQKWDKTLEDAQTDNISRLNYQPQRDVLNEYINKLNEKENNLDTRIDTSSKQAGETIEANNQTIKNAKIKLSILAGSKGTTRKNVFKDDVLDDPNTYKPSNSNSKDDSEAATIIDKILSLITTIGTVISVLMLAILGVKYMLGSVEEKAEYKKDLVPYFIGAALLFGICTVVKILQSLGDTINNL